MTTTAISQPRTTYLTGVHDGARTYDDMKISLSIVGEDLELLKKMNEFWDSGKPTTLMDELIAFYSGLDGDILPALCETCKGLEIDDSSFGGAIRACEGKEGCQHLFFLDLPRYVSHDGRAQFMSLPVPFARKDNLPELRSLAASAKEGCQFCSLLMSTLQNRGLTKNHPAGSTVSISNAQYEWHTDANKNPADEGSRLSDGSLHLFSLRVQVDSNQPFKLWFKISAPPISTAVWLDIPRQPPLEYPSADDGDGRFTFKSWLDEHIKACNGCQNPPRTIPTQTQHPTRLIDVAPPDQEDPRLVITKNHPQTFNPVGQEPPKYLALSYCWGEDSPTKHTTTNTNLLEHCQRIPLGDFPPACRDAVIVARSLGFRYLWIDACCIIQGDSEDWQQESRKMADIYGNAFLTIIPLSSGSSSEGFLPARSKSARIGFRSTLKEKARGAYWMHEVANVSSEDYDPKDFQRRTELTWPPPDLQSADEEHKKSRWVTRGWTFNEALMSPRKLKFGSRSVEFECYGCQFVERSLRRCTPIVELLKNHLWVQFMDKRGNARDIIGRYWTASQYHVSHRNFTNPTDRLLAISSFAELVSKKIEDAKKAKDDKNTEEDKTEDDKKTGDEYIAGLFRSDLHRGLTWNKKMEDKCEGFEDHVKKSFFGFGKDYVAPSWSWVSTPLSSYSWHAWADAAVTEADCDIEAEVQLENEDNPFGRVKSGHVILTSKAYRSDSMQLYMQEEKVRLKDHVGLEADMDLDWTLQMRQDENLQISDCPRDEHHPLFKSQGPLNDMHLVPLIQDEEGNETFGLIVIPFPKQPDGSWMRAGIFKSNKTWRLSENCPRKSFRLL